MKKVILGVVALCVAMSSVQAACEEERKRYAKCLKDAATQEQIWGDTSGKCLAFSSIRQERLKLESCLMQNGYY